MAQGDISRALLNERVAGCFTDGQQLIVTTASGREVYIEWGEDGPVLVRRVDCRLTIPAAVAPMVGLGKL